MGSFGAKNIPSPDVPKLCPTVGHMGHKIKMGHKVGHKVGHAHIHTHTHTYTHRHHTDTNASPTPLMYLGT